MGMRLAVIPARGGSKGLSGKNVRPLLGIPLIAWSIRSALDAPAVDRVVVSTDSEEIARVAQRYGAEVLERPAALATDEARTIAVLAHVATQVPAAETFVLLQPTSPVRDDGLIGECVALFEARRATNLATGFWCKYREFGTHANARRQDAVGFFYDDGNVYVLQRPLVEQGLWFGDRTCRHVIARHQSFEIDDEVDFVVCEALLERFGRQQRPVPVSADRPDKR